jgi:Uncharacterized protein conserved in bacteria
MTLSDIDPRVGAAGDRPDPPDPPVDGRLATAGEMVRARREALGLSKAAAGRRARVSLTTWRQVETGQAANPTDHTLVRMARAVLLDPADIMAAAGRKYEPAEADHVLPDDLARLAGEIPGAAPASLAAMTHEEHLMAALEGNPALDPEARDFLIRAYRLMVQRRTT